MDDLLIWWLTENDCQAIGDPENLHLPEYLVALYRSRLGRAGRGRIWSDAFDDVLQIDPNLIEISPARERILQSGGIVFRRWDIVLLRDLPGLITNLSAIAEEGDRVK